jgi:glucose-1-phosphate adenylyltransferase
MSLEAVVLILAGGRGTRLWPLTGERNKPAVPIAGKYRLIDIPISNSINSGYFRIFALTQGMDYSFNSHLQRAWSKDSFQVQIVSPQNVRGDYAGNADAVRQLMSTLKKHNPKVVFVAAGDHIVKMNYATMVKDLLNSNDEAIISLYVAPISRSGDLGAVELSSSGSVLRFEEKNKNTKLRAGKDPAHFYASMGIYAFKFDSLVEAFDKVKGNDFALDLMPYFISKGKLRGYSFKDKNEIPGFIVDENGSEISVPNMPDSSYWEDVGDIKQYFSFHMALLGNDPEFSFNSPVSRFDQQNKHDWWPIRTESRIDNGPPLFSRSTIVSDSMMNDGVNLSNVTAHNVVFSPNVFSRGSTFENCIIGEGSIIINSHLTNVIIDKLTIVEDLVINKDTLLNHVIQETPQGTLSRIEGGAIFRSPEGIYVIPRYFNTFRFNERLYRSMPQ